MPSYVVYYTATVSASVVVEAEDEAKARDLADEQFYSPHLCFACASEMDISDWEPVDEEWGTYKL